MENSNREGERKRERYSGMERYRGTRVEGKRNEEGKTISERLRDGEGKDRKGEIGRG